MRRASVSEVLTLAASAPAYQRWAGCSLASAAMSVCALAGLLDPGDWRIVLDAAARRTALAGGGVAAWDGV